MFSEFILLELNKREWSQSDLARAANISRTTVSDLITERRKPGKRTCAAIARGFGLPKETIYSAAGLLDEVTARRKVQEIIDYRLSLLEDKQLDEVLSFVDFIRERDKRE